MTIIFKIIMCTFNEAENAKLDEFQPKLSALINGIEKLESKISHYNSLYHYPDKSNLYSILDNRVSISIKDLNHTTKTLESSMEGIDLGLLIRAAEKNPEFDKLCKHPSLTALWDEKWRLCGRNTKEAAALNNLPVAEYKPQSTIHSFDLLKGLFFYGRYKIHLAKNDNENAQRYLHYAAKYGYFAALNTLVIQNMYNENTVKDALAYAEKTAELYRTPGFLVLFTLFYEKGMYSQALMNFLMAEKLLPHSEEMINNAYQGKTLHAITNSLLLDLSVKDWTEAKMHLAELTNIPAFFITATLDKQVTIMVDELLHKALFLNPLHGYLF